MIESPLDFLLLSGHHPARNPRVVKEAEALSAAGYRVAILTLCTHLPSVPLDRALAEGRPWTLHYAIDLTGRHGGSSFPILFHKIQTRLARKAVQSAHIELGRALGPVGPLLRAARRTPARVIITHTEMALWVGRVLAGEGRRVAADLEDWHSEDLLPESRHSRPGRLLRDLEAFHVRHAVWCTTTSHALAFTLGTSLSGPAPEVIYNVFPLPPEDASARSPGSPPVLIWFSQTVGAGRGLETLADALRTISSPWRLQLVGDVSPAYRQTLEARFGLVAAQVEWIAPVPPDKLPALLAGADIGLALETTAIPSRNLTVTNKLFQYLAAGLAVVATDTLGQREIATTAADAILVCPDENPVALALLLAPLLTDPATLARRKQAARLAATSVYSWERTAPQFVALAERNLR